MNIYRKLVGYPTRIKYWSNSSFARNIQNTFGLMSKPTAATVEEWREWINTTKQSRPTIFWITEDVLDIIQNIVYFPHDVYRNIRRYIRNRFIDKLHYIDTKLEPGEWYDCDSRLLHGMCELVVDFVEGEKAYCYDTLCYMNDTIPPLKDRRVAGLAYLEWEMSLNYNEDMGVEPTDDLYGQPTPQAETATAVTEIYLWWKDVRPSRPDAYDVSGWSEYCEKTRGTNDDIFCGLDSDKTEEDSQSTQTMLLTIDEIQKKYDNEDTQMLLRIVQIRKGLWT